MMMGPFHEGPFHPLSFIQSELNRYLQEGRGKGPGLGSRH